MASLYLIAPASSGSMYFGLDVFRRLGLPPAVFVADLALPTIAAMAPPGFDVRLCDEGASPADLECDSPFVGLTGKHNQFPRMATLAREYRRRGKVVIAGGPFASLSPEVVRPHCDILVRGELESVAPRLFEDLQRGRWQSEYAGEPTDLADSPVPRWELYPNERTMVGCVQTSRGCPFECEFCDVIQYVGRRQRHKPTPRVLQELDRLYGLGYRSVFLADDNLTVYRRRTRELLTALRDWNDTRPAGRMAFQTQVSIDVSRDEDILDLCAEAGLASVFIGIETPNEASLRETKKRQNLGVDLARELRKFPDRGIAVIAGIIVGFDSDDARIFEQQYEFMMASSVPVFTIGALTAPAATPLFERLRRAGRLVDARETGADANPFDTNIVPARMSREDLLAGLRWLVNRVYAPAAFRARLLRFVAECPEAPPPAAPVRGASLRPIEGELARVVRSIASFGAEEARMLSEALSASTRKPSARRGVMGALLRYAEIRHLYERAGVWNPALGQRPRPELASASSSVRRSRARSHVS